MSYYKLSQRLGIWAFLVSSIIGPRISDADFINGDFETGDTTGWTITVGRGAEYTNHAVVLFDMNDTDPGGLSMAARFSVGKATNGDTEYRHIDFTQQLDLVAGQRYEFSFDWAAHNFFFFDNFDGGVFDLIVDGESLASWDTQNIFTESTEWGSLNGTYLASQTGGHTVGARISRRFRSTNNGSFILGQYLDNFTATTQSVPEPNGGALLLGLGAFGLSLNRRNRTAEGSQ